MHAPDSDSNAPTRARAARWFGRMQLLRLLGKSERTMAWRVADPRSGQELMLVLPRVQPADAAAFDRWQMALRQASRLDHPRLAAVVESGVQDGWPYVAYDPRDGDTLVEKLPAKGLPGADAAALGVQLLEGLAFAHEAGVAHHDVQPFLVLLGENGSLRLTGLAVADELAQREGEGTNAQHADPQARLRQRLAAERDLLAVGLLLHGVVAGHGALDEPDIGRLIQRMPPLGREIVRLPWTVAHPVAEPLRAIINRATDRQERQRYRSARTLQRALEGWLQSEASGDGGALALLSGRLRTLGALPSMPGAARRAARLALMERERTNELAEVVLEDLALSFELLRAVNSAQVRGTQLSGSGPILTVRRAIAMVGMDGVRRAALSLRDWPGPLHEGAAVELQRLIERCKRAGRVAVALRPAAYDAEVVYLLAMLQSLGRLVVHYHFADEAQQIRRLMLPAPSARAGEPDEPGMSEQGAAFAVLGTDIESIGSAVARYWGLDDGVLAMIRRLPLTTAVHATESDDELLRTVASCANEAVDALGLPPPRLAGALQQVVHRYGRVLGIDLRELQGALQGTPVAATETGASAPGAATGEDGEERQPGLRATATARAASVVGTSP